ASNRTLSRCPNLLASMHPLLILLVGMATILVAIVGLRLSAFLALITAAIVVSLLDRKSTRLNSSHGSISYAVFCLKKKKYIKSKGALTNTDIANDPVLYGKLPPFEMYRKAVSSSCDSTNPRQSAEAKCYRCVPQYV